LSHRSKPFEMKDMGFMTQFRFLPVCSCDGIVCAGSPNHILMYAHGLSQLDGLATEANRLK
ncbi:hypothetical protein ACNPKB_19530, partial [Shewanella marisflavi]|uniref:hypothetical protein n=1 Tax=Shewanella marisflavi TaxID=260364 RepID=UPI003AAFDE1A